jgi:hypothetical protein
MCPGTLRHCFGNFLKLNIHPPYNPTIPFLGIYIREMKVYVHTKTRNMNAPRRSIVNSSKLETTQNKCQPTDEWINKL